MVLDEACVRPDRGLPRLVELLVRLLTLALQLLQAIPVARQLGVLDGQVERARAGAPTSPSCEDAERATQISTSGGSSDSDEKDAAVMP